MTLEDRGLLKEFVSKVYSWLQECYLGQGYPVSKFNWPLIRVEPELRDFAVPAWEEFSKEFPLKRILAPIDQAKEELLTAHGLSGAQLRYKLQLVDVAADKANAGIRGWARRFIELIDNIIDSLGPTGIAGGLKELKDALTGSLPENE